MGKISRREFLCSSAAALVLPLGCPFARVWAARGGPSDIRGSVFQGDAPKELWRWSREGAHYSKPDEGRVACGICPNGCILSPGDRSVCRSRVNIEGRLYSLAYGNPCSVNVDPIEKKPLFHFMPGTAAFSIAAAGCSFRCLNCQNWEISQVRPEDVRSTELFPDGVVKAARESGARSIAYTYSEPTTYFEYMFDTARLARSEGIRNLWISNGYINRKPLKELVGVLDAANVNLKAYSDEIYRKLNGGRLDPVLNTFRTMHEEGLHFEITNLVVPGYTDDADMVARMCAWILEALGPDHPLHFLRFFPRYKLDRLPPTPVATLTNYRQLAMEAGIRYVYVGNVPGHEGTDTYCHNCGRLLVERKGYAIPTFNIDRGMCRFCGTRIPGVWAEGAGMSVLPDRESSDERGPVQSRRSRQDTSVG